MRKILLLLLISATSVSAQVPDAMRKYYDDAVYQGNRRKPESTHVSAKTQTLSAGDYLKRAASQRMTSTLSGFASGFMLGVAPSMDEKSTRNAVVFGGVAIGIVSIVTHFMSINSESKAGDMLNNERRKDDHAFVIKPANEGLGLNLTF